MRIGKDTNVTNIISDISTLSSSLSTLESTYKNSITALNNDTRKIIFNGSWSDPVQVKVEEYVESLKSDTSSIETDITSGNFQSLKKKLNELKAELENLETNRQNLKERTAALNSERSKDKDKRDEARISQLEKAVSSANTLIENNVSRANALFTDISNIEFNKVYQEQDIPAIAIEPIDVMPPTEEEQPEEEEKQTEDHHVGRQMTIQEILAEKDPNAIIYDPSESYYVVTTDIGHGEVTYYFPDEQHYKEFMQARELYMALRDATVTGNEITVTMNGQEITLYCDEMGGYPPMDFSETYLQTYYSSMYGINVINGYNSDYFSSSSFVFYGPNGEEYTMLDLVQNAQLVK